MLVTIDCGIGEIAFREPENLKLKMLLDALKDHIEIYGVDEVMTYLTENATIANLKLEIQELEIEVNSKGERITELEDLFEESEVSETIDCGIGNITYETPSNLALQDVMENLGAAITKTNFKKVNEVLSAI